VTTPATTYTPGSIPIPFPNAFVREPATSGQGMTLAQAADSAALDNLPARFLVTDVGVVTAYGLEAGGTATVVWSYTPTPQAAYLYLEWDIPGNVRTSDTMAVDLTISNGIDTPITSSVGVIASQGRSWNGTAIQGTNNHPVEPIVDITENRYQLASVGGSPIQGGFDLTEIATLLPSSPDYTITFACTFTGAGYILAIRGFEIPRFLVNQSPPVVGPPPVTYYGVVPGDCFPRQPITDSLQASLGRILQTLQVARVTQARYLTLAWPLDDPTADPGGNSVDLPRVTTTTLGPFEFFAESTTVPMKFNVPVRQVYAGSAAGELVRWRVYYWTTSGSGGLKIQMETGSTSSPFLATLPDTSGAWEWSAWQSGYLRSDATQIVSGTTNLIQGPTTAGALAGLGGDYIQFEGHVVNSGSYAAYLAAVEVDGDCA
jgi:hypothetical protein